MTPREMAKSILPNERRSLSYFEPEEWDPGSKRLNVIMSSVVLLDILDKAKGGTSLNRKVTNSMERLRQSIGEFADAEGNQENQAKEELASKKVVKFSRWLARNVLYDPGIALKAERGAALDAAVLSVLLALMDAGMHQAPWDAPLRDVKTQIVENRVVLEKMAGLMSGNHQENDENDENE